MATYKQQKLGLSASHHVAARIKLQHLEPSQRAALVHDLKSLPNFSTVLQANRLSFFVSASNVYNHGQARNVARWGR